MCAGRIQDMGNSGGGESRRYQTAVHCHTCVQRHPSPHVHKQIGRGAYGNFR